MTESAFETALLKPDLDGEVFERKPASPEVATAHLSAIADLLKTEPVKPHTEVDP